jgi:hypothetical protein
VQRVLREPTLPPQRRKGTLSFLLLAAGDGACRLPGRIGPHAAQAPLSFGKDGVIELARGFQMGTEALRLAGRHLER